MKHLEYKYTIAIFIMQTASHLGYPRKHLGNLENSEYQVAYHSLFKTQTFDVCAAFMI